MLVETTIERERVNKNETSNNEERAKGDEIPTSSERAIFEENYCQPLLLVLMSKTKRLFLLER